MDVVRNFRDTYNFGQSMSERSPKKEDGEPIKIPEYVKEFKGEYNIIKIKSERPPKKEDGEPI